MIEEVNPTPFFAAPPMHGNAFPLVLAAVFLLAGCSTRDMAFDPQAWRDARTSIDSDARERMTRPLMESNRLLGLSRQQVIALLGPDERYDSTPPLELWYVVSRNFGTGIDPVSVEHLVLDFDASGHVARQRLVKLGPG